MVFETSISFLPVDGRVEMKLSGPASELPPDDWNIAAQNMIKLFEQKDVTIIYRDDRFVVGRPIYSIGKKQSAIIQWYWVCLAVGIISKGGYHFIEQTAQKVFFAMTNDGNVGARFYYSGEWVGGYEAKAALEGYISRTPLDIDSLHREVLTYASKFVTHPTPFGEFAQRIVGGSSASSGWAASR